MRINPIIVYQHEKTYQTAQGYIIKVKMKLQVLPNLNKREFPQDYKFSWIAYSLENANERVLFDNHHGKSPHFHIDEEQTHFTWLSPKESEKLFWEKVQKRFGTLKYYDKK